jgi:hypothetical protein
MRVQNTDRQEANEFSVASLLPQGGKLRLHLPNGGGVELVLALEKAPSLSTLRQLAELSTFPELSELVATSSVSPQVYNRHDKDHADIIRVVAAALADWEDSGELYSPFAHRLVAFILCPQEGFRERQLKDNNVVR